MPQRSQRPRPYRRYGAGELFGNAVSCLSPDQLRRVTIVSDVKKKCPFKGGEANCTKKGGVCSLVLYEAGPQETGTVVGLPITTCPNRFLENNLVHRWVSQTILGFEDSVVVSEIPFLMGDKDSDIEAEDGVGRIDKVLIDARGDQLRWCALEMQAVYFSGAKMERDFAVMRDWQGPGLPFPPKHRRPDYRSSGPKRLMPQLQIKVPTLRRWGKKMAVVVDIDFWESLWPMRQAKHITNADIVWFVVGYEEDAKAGRYRLKKHEIFLTTLEDAVEGLTGGIPVSLDEFEKLIRGKLERVRAR